MKKYLLKEYGSWGVMTLAFLTGALNAGRFNAGTAAAYIAISLYINSKQAFTLWMRRPEERKKSLSIFLIQVIAATLLFLPIIRHDISRLLPYAFFPIAYIVLLKFKGEHAIVTEASGFVLLSMSALMAKFAGSGNIDPKIFIATAVFFTAGVFKVRVQFRKRPFERISMVSYIAFALSVYLLLGISPLLLLPLLENLLFAVFLYRVGLSATGWTEMAKGVLFLILTTMWY